MKKSVISKLISVAMAGTMVAGMLTGCGSTAAPAASSAAPAASSAAPASTAAPAASTEAGTAASTEAASAAAGGGVDSWTPFTDKVELSIPVYDRGVEGVPDVASNYWTKWVQTNFGDKYNINVTYVPITRSDVMTDYSLLAAAGTLPTILMEYDYPKLAQWADDGYLATFNMDDFAAVAPTYYNRMVADNQIPYTTMNGDTYYCLAERPDYQSTYSFQTFVRMDWLKAVGYDHVPVTRKEYLDAMQKIMDKGLSKHPLGGAMITGQGADQDYFYRDFPQNEEDWAKYSSVTTYSLGSAANKKMLKEWNEDYNLGIMDPEYYTTDVETDKSNFVNGKTYQYAGYISGTMDWLESFYKNNPDAELAILPVMDKDDTEGGKTRAYRSSNPFGMIIGFSAKASEDQLKAAWMYMEWMTQEDNLFTMQWGDEGDNYTKGDDGLPVSVADYDGDKKQGYNNNKDYWCVTIEARNAGTIEQRIAQICPQGLPQDFTQDVIKYYNDQIAIADQGYACIDPLFSVAIASETENAGTLLEDYKEFRDKIIMAKTADFDKTYDDYAKQYADAGFQDIVDERDAAYKAGNCSKLEQK